MNNNVNIFVEKGEFLDNIKRIYVRSVQEANILHYILHENGILCNEQDFAICCKSIMSEICYEYFSKEAAIPIDMYMNNIDLVSYFYTTIGVLGLNPPLEMPSVPGTIGKKLYVGGSLVFKRYYGKNRKRNTFILKPFEEQLCCIHQEIACCNNLKRPYRPFRNRRKQHSSKKLGGVWFRKGSGEKYEALKAAAEQSNSRPFIRVIYTPMKG